MAKTVRLSDIAKKLKVSTVTVSKALSGQKGVSDELREKIRKQADEMGYVKSAAVERKKDGSYTLGVIVAERYLKENQSFYWDLYQEISKRATMRNCFTMLEVIGHDVEKQLELPKIASERKVDGIIIMGAFKWEYAGYLSETLMVPFVYLDTLGTDEKSDSVVSNNLAGGYQMTNYLFELGHKKIGFVGTRLATNSIDDRYFGYLKSMMEHGAEWNDDWVIDDRDREFGKVDFESRFVLPQDMPTAFFCNCDLSASLMIRKLTEAGYSVPDDVSVIGFDNYVTDQFSPVGLTTYEIDTKEMARRAIHILIHKIGNVNYSTGVFMLAGTFIERDSAKRVGKPVPFV